MEIGTVIKPSKVMVSLWVLFNALFIAILAGVAVEQHDYVVWVVVACPFMAFLIGGLMAFGDHVVLGPQRSLEFRTRRFSVRRVTLDVRPMRDGARSMVMGPWGIKMLYVGAHRLWLWPYMGRQQDIIDWAQGHSSVGDMVPRSTRPASSGRSARPPESGA